MKTKIIALLLALICVALLACDGNGNKNESDIVSENESDIVSENESSAVSANETSTNSDAITEQKVIVETDTHFNCNLEELSAHLESECKMCKDLSEFMIPTYWDWGQLPERGFKVFRFEKYDDYTGEQFISIIEDENNKDSYIRLLVRVDIYDGIAMDKDTFEKSQNEMKEIYDNRENIDTKKAWVDWYENSGKYFEEYTLEQFSSIGVSAKRMVANVYEILITPAQIEMIKQEQIPMYMEAFPCPQGITSKYALEFMYRTYRAPY